MNPNIITTHIATMENLEGVLALQMHVEKQKNTFMKKLILVSILLISVFCNAQNIVFYITGNPVYNGRLIKKNDNLPDNAQIIFGSKDGSVKLLTRKGICYIKSKDILANPNIPLLEHIKKNIFKYSVATLSTKSQTIKIPSEDQVKKIDSLCFILGTNSKNIFKHYDTYIVPYAYIEFKTPDWKNITNLLIDKYGYKEYNYLGDISKTEEINKLPKTFYIKTKGDRQVLPKASLKKYCPYAGYQGSYGTCAGWASAYAARTISWAIQNDETDIENITNHAFSPTYVYQKLKDPTDIDCSEGVKVTETLVAMNKNGVVLKSDLDEPCINSNVDYLDEEASKYKIADFSRFEDCLQDFKDAAIKEEKFQKYLDLIRLSITNKRPILASILTYKSFKGNYTNYAEVWNGKLEGIPGMHAICIIGYDDGYANGEGAVEILNSWGQSFGINGYIWIKYKDLKNILNFCLTFYDTIKKTSTPLERPIPNSNEMPLTIKLIEEEFNELEGELRFVKNGKMLNAKSNVLATKNIHKSSNSDFTYSFDEILKTGDKFNIYINSNKSAYVYLITSDSNNSAPEILYPYDDYSPLLLFDNSEINTGENELGNVTGEDYICLLFSKEKIDIDSLKKYINNSTEKNFNKNIKTFLNEKLMTSGDITFETDKIKFSAKSKDKTIIPVFFKIIHQ